MKTINRIICVVVLLVVGFAAGFPIGSTIGFDGGMFRVIMKQPRGLYKKVWQQADKHDKRFDDMKGMNKPVVTANDVVFASDGEKTF